MATMEQPGFKRGASLALFSETDSGWREGNFHY